MVTSFFGHHKNIQIVLSPHLYLLMPDDEKFP